MEERGEKEMRGKEKAEEETGPELRRDPWGSMVTVKVGAVLSTVEYA